MARRKRQTPADQFNITLRRALEHFSDVDWLAANSPLATPYFLGHYLTDETDRGAALQAVLRQALTALWPGHLPSSRSALESAVEQARQLHGNKGDQYAYLLLEVRYFRQYFGTETYPATASDIPHYLAVSTTRFFVHLEEAIRRLGEILLRQLRPTLRLEQPRLQTTVIGRSTLKAHAIEALSQRQSVSLSGTGGIGKTTLGTAIADDWLTPVFWYTFRPNLNDNLYSLLFALSHFIQQHTPSLLWLQLLADTKRTTDRTHLLGLLRGDLANLRALTVPLLCFDEVDLLHTSESTPRAETHAELLELIEALNGELPLLLIGQRLYIDTDQHFALTPFDVAHTRQLLEGAGVRVSAELTDQIHTYTQGIPRLITLVIALIESGDQAADLVALHKRGAARPLFHRLWRRLDRKEQELLAALCVFRSAVPADAWTEHQAAITSLAKRQVLRRDGAGALTLLPFVRALVYEELHPEQRETLHDQAARLRAVRGDYTAAAYHFWQADLPVAAIAVWYPHRRLEIQRGQQRAALEIFGQLSTTRLKGNDKKQLKLIQNELYMLTGQAERIIAGMAHYTWEMDDQLSATAFYQWGEAERTLGQFEEAEERYGRSLQVLAGQVNAMMENAFGRMQAQVSRAALQAARTEAERAHFMLLKLKGYLEFSAVNYPAAQAHFLEALALAESLNLVEEGADMHQLLSVTFGRLGAVAAAQTHADQAIQRYQQLGNRLMVESVRAEVAGVYLNVGDYAKVIAPSEQALQFFEQIKHSPRIASLCNNLAEAYLETGNLLKAKSYAHRVLRLEEQRSLPYALYTLGLVHQREGNPEHALTSFQEGIRLAQQNADRFIEAHLQKVLGQLHLAQGDQTAAKTATERSGELFEGIHLK